MTDAFRSDMDLRPLFNKLGHKLEEIRVRALNNLLSKLEHNLLCEVDIVQERHLFIRLLEWFNFSKCPQQRDVLQLLQKLTKHPSGATLVVEIGGVEFLTQLRSNVEPALHTLIDATLDQLFHLPSSPPISAHDAECIYKANASIHSLPCSQTASSAAFGNQSVTSVWSSASAHHPHASHSTAPQHSPPPAPHPPQGGWIASPPDSQAGYFGRTPATQQLQTGSSPSTNAVSFKLSTFPWVALMSTDRHVISSTDSSLRNRDPNLVVSACDFLSDVVFQDFPAEVFLQRPSIVKSLLSLIDVEPVGGVSVAQPALHALHDLSVCLQARLSFYQDPALYTPKQDFTSTLTTSSSGTSGYSHSLGSSDTRPSLIGRSDPRQGGDGQDRDPVTGAIQHNASDGNLDELESEDIATLQFMQWSLPQYAVAVLHTILPMLASPQSSVVSDAIQLLTQVEALLQEVVDPTTLWEDRSVPSREIIEKLTESFELMADALQFHHHSGLSSSTPSEELTQHQLAFIGIANFVSSFVKLLVPLEKVELAVPEMAYSIFTMLALDASLSLSHPKVRLTLFPYVERVAPDVYNNFLRTKQICSSQKSTVEFLSKWPEQLSVDGEVMISRAHEGLASLLYHQHLYYVDAAILLSSHVGRKSNTAANVSRQARQVVLSLLSHFLEHVKIRAYVTVRNVVMESLGVERATEPSLSASKSINFLLHPHILYEIACFGMGSSIQQVSDLAGQILLHLLQGQLLMTSDRWLQLLEALTPVLPVLQGFAAQEKGVGGCVLGLLDTTSQGNVGMLSIHERFRGTLRLLYRHETRMRSEGLGRLAWFLSQEPGGVSKLPQFSDLQVRDLTNIFIVQTPTFIQDEDVQRSVFQEEGLRKVFEIFSSDMVEDDVKKSALDQLAIMLQDPALHKAFKRFDGTSLVIKHLHGAVKRPASGYPNHAQTMLPSLLKILRHMVQRDFSLRHRLAQKSDTYYSVVRAALIYCGDEDARKEASHLLALLLWDEMASVATWDADVANASQKEVHFTLPVYITNRYRLPFRCATHHNVSPYARPSPPASDPLQEGILAQAIRLDWWQHWQGGVEPFSKWCMEEGRSEDRDDSYTGPLQLTKVDRILGSVSYLPTRVQALVHQVENATSHGVVRKGVSQVLYHITASGVDKVAPILSTNKWYSSLDRFLRVKPSSNVDETLLADVLRMLCQLLNVKCHRVDSHLVTWLSSAIHDSQGALVSLLSRPEATEDLPEATQQTRRLVNRQLLRFVHTFVGKLPYCLTKKRAEEHCIRGIVTQAVLSRLKSTDAAHFYNLASLERTLLALIHITARPGWSAGAPGTDSFGLCLLMLHSLLEVVAAFHVGRGGMSMSYMGRGVTRGATLCLRHLAYEMSTQIHSQDWPRNWLYTSQASSSTSGASGFEWLTPLWSYRDPEVRAAGLGIAVALTSTEAGRLTMVTQCDHIHGGIWGAAFGVLLDQSECSLVRQKAALLLINLTSQPLPTTQNDLSTVWQGPVIRNDHTQESVMGLPALIALLHHTQFYQEVILMLSNYYPQPTIRPVSIATDTHSTTLQTSSENTLTTSGTASPPSVVGNGWKPVTSTPLSDASSEFSASRQGGVRPEAPSAPSTRPASHSSYKPDSGQDAPVSNSPASNSVWLSEYPSVTSPGLVAVIAQLLNNLLHLAPENCLDRLSNEGVLKMMSSVIDVSLLEAYIQQVSSHSSPGLHRVALMDLLRAHINVTSLLQTCVTLDTTICKQVLQETTALKQLCQILAISCEGDVDVSTLCEQLWKGVFTLLRVLIQEEGQEALTVLTPVITKNWHTIAARCIYVLQTVSSIDAPHWFATLYFLAVLFAEESRAETSGGREEGVMTLTYRLDNASKSGGEARLFSGPSGPMMCGVLVQVYDTVWLHQGEKAFLAKCALTAALKGLLAVSSTAKERALEGGLAETVCDQLKRRTMALNIEALEAPKTNKSGKKKETGGTAEIILTIDLLRNFMHNNYDVKLAAYECGLAQCLHKLWAWSQIDSSLLTSVLALLATFTARCPPACASLVFTSAMGVMERAPATNQYSPHSLLHCLIKLVQKESAVSGNVTTLKSLFAVLATVTLSQECRGVLWKSNFIHDFSRLTPKKPKKARIQQALEMCWLKLFVNLSFSTDGQGMILKVNDASTLLVEYANGSSEPHKKCAILILRNLCFHAANKPRLLANDLLGPLLVRNVEVGTSEIQSMATSALLALTYNCQKAKVTLKTTATVRRLQETYNSLVYIPKKTREVELSTENLKSVLTLLKS